ncbi:hypothetical protein ACJMK2_003416 [Sinanodonta woodiana]|uniref:Uncharacterized protein n=1 Tax=Sinanodonta woodiana TaxID=1069815 RepID=A0ABD3Y0H5_SINWO
MASSASQSLSSSQSSKNSKSSQQGDDHPVDHPVDPEPLNQDDNLRGSRSKLSLYFEVQLDGDTLYAYHSRGCQLISFSVEEIPPRQAEILMSLQSLEVNMRGIRGLQNAGRNSYMLFPVDKEQKLLNFVKFDVLGKKSFGSGSASHSPGILFQRRRIST